MQQARPPFPAGPCAPWLHVARHRTTCHPSLYSLRGTVQNAEVKGGKGTDSYAPRMAVGVQRASVAHLQPPHASHSSSSGPSYFQHTADAHCAQHKSVRDMHAHNAHAKTINQAAVPKSRQKAETHQSYGTGQPLQGRPQNPHVPKQKLEESPHSATATKNTPGTCVKESSTAHVQQDHA